jgi:hypothetical protein
MLGGSGLFLFVFLFGFDIGFDLGFEISGDEFLVSALFCILDGLLPRLRRFLKIECGLE